MAFLSSSTDSFYMRLVCTGRGLPHLDVVHSTGDANTPCRLLPHQYRSCRTCIRRKPCSQHIIVLFRLTAGESADRLWNLYTWRNAWDPFLAMAIYHLRSGHYWSRLDRLLRPYRCPGSVQVPDGRAEGIRH